MAISNPDSTDSSIFLGMLSVIMIVDKSTGEIIFFNNRLNSLFTCGPLLIEFIKENRQRTKQYVQFLHQTFENNKSISVSNLIFELHPYCTMLDGESYP